MLGRVCCLKAFSVLTPLFIFLLHVSAKSSSRTLRSRPPSCYSLCWRISFPTVTSITWRLAGYVSLEQVRSRKDRRKIDFHLETLLKNLDLHWSESRPSTVIHNGWISVMEYTFCDQRSQRLLRANYATIKIKKSPLQPALIH